MSPKPDPKYDVAVKLVLDGMDISVAWEQSGKPGGEQASALRNIRKRVALVRAREAEASDLMVADIDFARRGGDAAGAPGPHATPGGIDATPEQLTAQLRDGAARSSSRPLLAPELSMIYALLDALFM